MRSLRLAGEGRGPRVRLPESALARDRRLHRPRTRRPVSRRRTTREAGGGARYLQRHFRSDWLEGEHATSRSDRRVDAFSDLRGPTFGDRRKIVSCPRTSARATISCWRRTEHAPRHQRAVGPIALRSRSTRVRSFRSGQTGVTYRVYAGGIRAPVGLTFFSGTETCLVSMANQRDDLGSRTPGDGFPW